MNDRRRVSADERARQLAGEQPQDMASEDILEPDNEDEPTKEPEPAEDEVDET